MIYTLESINRFDLNKTKNEILLLYLKGLLHMDICNRLRISSDTLITELNELKKHWSCFTNWGIAVESLRRGYSRKFLEAHQHLLANHRVNVFLDDKERRFLQLRVYDLKFSDIAKLMKMSESEVIEIHTDVLGKFGIKNDMELLAVVLVNRLVVVPISI